MNAMELAGTKWYVPAENLLAYLTDPALRVQRPVADQTLWSITSAEGGRFEGTSQTRLWAKGRDGEWAPAGTASNAMSGTIEETGEITIVFTPDDPDPSTTVGYGHLRRVQGEWRMEMQMATGAQSLALHWAYMARWAVGDAIPEPARDFPDPELRSDEWRWLAGSAWYAADEELFPQGAAFTVDSDRNGYFWGEGTTASGDPLRVAGSVTPEGSLYLLFSVSAQPAAARRGMMEADPPRMSWTLPEGGPVIGTATGE